MGNVGHISGTHNHGESSSESRREGSRVARGPSLEKDSAWEGRGEEQSDGRGEKVKKDKIEGQIRVWLSAPPNSLTLVGNTALYSCQSCGLDRSQSPALLSG